MDISGKEILDIRLAAGISQIQLAKEAKVGRYKISNFEECLGRLSKSDLRKVLNAIHRIIIESHVRVEKAKKMCHSFKKGTTWMT